MQNKPQMVEAVLFFNEQGICKEMLHPEFEALLDGVVDLPEFADQQMRAAYVLVNSRLQIRSAVLFYLDFTEEGGADSGWNIPLRQLAERAGRGPDLGAGPIRLACRSRCPVNWHQMHLWDPGQTAGQSDLALLRDCMRRNNLGLLVEEDVPPMVAPERLQVAAEDRWYAADAPSAEPSSVRPDQEQRLKAALLIKRQRLKIDSLLREHEEALASARQQAEQQRRDLHDELHRLRARVDTLEQENAGLKAELVAGSEQYQQAREELARQVRALERNSQSEAEALRQRLEADMQARIAAAVADYQEQVAVRDVELGYRDELDSQLQQEIERLKQEASDREVAAGKRAREELAASGLMFVAYHPGAGHLTVPLTELARYVESPQAYAASKCNVSLEHYRRWLAHYQAPVCQAERLGAGVCAKSVVRVDSPGRFVLVESECCELHQGALRKTGS